MDVLPGQPDQTVHIRVQVVDMKSFTLDLQVPTYLPARDLTQRVARDAGLEAHWPDGRRRLYWLRARGRLVSDDETLAELAVVNGELVYLLPEPPAGSGVLEQEPDYPPNRGYPGKGVANIVIGFLMVCAWALGWGLALTVERSFLTVVFPGAGMGFLLTSLSRHVWGGQGSSPRIPITASLLFIVTFVLVFLPGIASGDELRTVVEESVGGFFMGMAGVVAGWVAWWGAVEPLPERTAEEAVLVQAAVVTVPCGICSLEVTPEVRTDCPHACGQSFHTGCHNARLAVYRGDQRFCAICSARVA
jgi:uncharacterized ubiquitin-like protein YukD